MFTDRGIRLVVMVALVVVAVCQVVIAWNAT